jgi:hypothetical protein
MKKIYYQPNSEFGYYQDIKTFHEIKIFGRKNPMDSKNGETLFHNIPNAVDIFVEEVRGYDPDFIFFESFKYQMVECLRRVRKFYKKPIVGLWGDCVVDRYTLNILTRIGRYCNLVLVIDKQTESVLKSKGINAEYTLLPSGDLFKNDKTIERKYDIVMAGNPYSPNRFSNAQQRIDLARLFSKYFKFTLFGSEKWNQYGIKTEGWVDFSTLPKIYNQAKIVISCDSVIDKKGFTSNRTHNVMCSGTFLLIRKFSGIEELFVNHEHLVWFETNQEAIDLVKYYLIHDNEREAIAMKGMRLAQEKTLMSKCFNNWMTRQYDEKKIPLITNIYDFIWVRINKIMLKFVRTKIAIKIRNKIGFYVCEV